ncbi:peptidylprolyl isomerase [Nonlabens xiamenensis]|uniref:peptidylprolyl isomerase n=1 Tax=Nonlabens xiamenensis TaxID=2341043 RepID=UPI000F6102E5|nr:peptidylprolyl isomerase [Nonlabens xiamenensis]
MRNFKWILVVFCLAAQFSNSQELKDKTLLSIDGTDYDAGTFIKFYFKNLDIVQDDQQKDVDNYLNLYIDYRLKLQQAKSLGLDQKEEYLKEIQSTRSGIAQAFLTDNEVSEQLVRQAYERSKEEVNASHILIKVSRDASPADTLNAWNRIQDLYRQATAPNADFATLARTKSEGPSAGNAGELGWFGAFRMVYEFENAAYQTPVGQVSEPFRTDFGYHILKVNDRRSNPGEITVAHIMTFDKKEVQEQTAAQRIQEIYSQLKAGKDFAELAREFSDDVNSASRGGRLNKFGTGGIDPTFAEAAFEIPSVGEYTQPIQTPYGWHIIQLLERHPVPAFEKQEKSLRGKIQKSPRSQKITEAFIKKLKDKYGISENLKLPTTLLDMVDDSLLLKNEYKLKAEHQRVETPVFNIQDQSYTYTEFLTYVEQQQLKETKVYPSKKAKLSSYFDQFVNDKLRAYYDEHLEEDNEDFAFLYNEFKEGFLIFDLIETKVWEKAKTDSVGQMNFYENHKNDYQWKRRLDLIITQSTSEETAEQVKKLLEQGVEVDSIKERFNIDNRTKVMVSKGIVDETYSRLPEDFEVRKGVSQIYHDAGDSFYKVIQVNEILEPTIKSLEEARGAVINDYQQTLERQWLEQLRDGKKIKVNKKVLKKVKQHIEDQKRT